MLALSRHIINRVNGFVPGFRTVGNASLFAPIDFRTDITTMLPACVISPGAGEMIDNVPQELLGLEEQEWHVSVLVGYGHDDEQIGIAEIVASEFMMNVYKALHGYKADNGDMRTGFIYKGRNEPVYNTGWALFPMIFSARAVIGRGEITCGDQ